MLIVHKELKNTIQVHSMTVMTHVIALEVRQSSQGTFEHITPEYPDEGPVRLVTKVTKDKWSIISY